MKFESAEIISTLFPIFEVPLKIRICMEQKSSPIPLFNTINTGNKHYELTNHLGNVNVVITNNAIPTETSTGSGEIDHYTADVKSAVDY